MKAIKGDIAHSPRKNGLEFFEQGVLMVDNGVIADILPALPRGFEGEVEDFGSNIIMPSFCDLHLHAPQYPMVGLGMDLPLMDWLNNYTFALEARFKDTGYAREVYSDLANALIRQGTTRVCMFSSIHTDSTLVLMEELEKAGVTGYVGKVNMDRLSAPEVTETTAESLAETERFIKEARARFTTLHPMITPRFTPSCSDELMYGLGRLAKEYDVAIQSHISENDAEIATVKELCPDCDEYWETYAKRGLWNGKTVMAHCVHCSPRERRAMKEAGVWVIHCPASNSNIYSGIAPIKSMLEEGLNIALGSDIAGGDSLSMRRSFIETLKVSKLRYYYSGKSEEDKFLTVTEGYSILASGAEFFGASRGFAPGDRLHAVAMDETPLAPDMGLSMQERFERMLYFDDPSTVKAVWSEGIRRK